MSENNSEDNTKAQGKRAVITASSILKLAIPLILASSALVVYNLYSVGAYQQMSRDISESMFSDESIDAVLLTYRTNDNIKELTINVTGVEGKLLNYQPELVEFVCSSDFLLQELAVSHQVQIRLIAKLRKQDKYLDVEVSQEHCQSL